MTVAAVVVPREKGRLSRSEAEELTNEIRTHANRLWMLVALAYDRKAWRSLGYSSWKSYVDVELAISEARSYQLVDTGRVMLAIADATGVDPASLEPVPARAVAKVKGDLPALRKALRAQLRDNEDLDEVVTAAIAEVTSRHVVVPAQAGPEQVDCPVCDGSGRLGDDAAAQELARRALRWLARATG